jgi:hypothetical protein
MTSQTYPVEVQSDFLEKMTRARPVQALSEMIWNSFDADASRVSVSFQYNDLGTMSSIAIRDDGTGIAHADAPELFRRLGGSWKRPGATTKHDGRFLHGQDGRGRFKAFALGRVAEWDVTYEKKGKLFSFTITMLESKIREVIISDEIAARAGKTPGTTVTISEVHKDFQSLTSPAGQQELTEIFALYLTDYQHLSLHLAGVRIDPATVIESRHKLPLADLSDDGHLYPAALEIIEWKSATKRALYLCNEKGFPLLEVDRRFHVGPYQFSAYLKSQFVSTLQKQGTLELAEMNEVVVKSVDEAQQAIKDYFRERASRQARTVVDDWKSEQVYPYAGEATSHVETVERQVFDIVAVNVARYLPDFESAEPKNKALHLRLLRQAIEKSPEDLQVILDEVLKLPKRKQEELAQLLRDVSLSAIINAAKVVADRLRFLQGLEAVLFDGDTKARLKERSQLHRIVAENAWLFGEEFNISVDDQSLTEVLRKHKKLLGEEVVINEPVRHISKDRGIVDLMLSRAIRRHRMNDLTHLVVELKAPKVKIDAKEITQVEEYAFSVMADERFRNVRTTWQFWVVSDDFGEYARGRITDESGAILTKDRFSIFVKTWAQVIEENRIRLQFFQERLEYQADKGASLKHLQEHYAKFLEGVGLEANEAPHEANEQDAATDKSEAQHTV